MKRARKVTGPQGDKKEDRVRQETQTEETTDVADATSTEVQRTDLQRSAHSATSSMETTDAADSRAVIGYNSGPDRQELEDSYGIKFLKDGQAQKVQRLEQEFGSERVKQWVDGGMTVETMGKPQDMQAFRDRQDARPEEVPSDIERRNQASVQRNAAGQLDGERTGNTDVPDSVREVISSPGHSLDESIQRTMEERMGDSFEDVRIHTGPKAAQAAEDINARAFTVGNHIAFNRGEYDPESSESQHVIAHELAHVRQQTSGGGGPVSQRLPADGALTLGETSSPQEREAESVARNVLDPDQNRPGAVTSAPVTVERMSVADTIDYSNTETLPRPEDAQKTLFWAGANEKLPKAEYISLAGEERETFWNSLQEKYGEDESAVPFDGGSVRADERKGEETEIEYQNGAQVTANDVITLARVWKQDKSGDPAGNIWEQMNKLYHDIETTVKGRNVPNNLDDLELTDNAKNVLEELNTASRAFLETNHEQMDAVSMENEEMKLTMWRGANSFEAAHLGIEQLENINSDILSYSASAVLNFSVSRDLADGYARATTGAVIRKNFQWEDVVVAMDQLSAVKKEQPYAPEEFENELMHDGEIQVSGDAVSEVPATNFLVQDGGGHVPFRQTLASPETLSAAGCQKAIDLIQIVAEEVSGSSTLSDEKAHGVLKHFYEYIDDNFGLAVSQELEQAIKDITGKTPDEISS